MANLNFNKIILGGRLTADPELKTTQSGVSVTSFSIAVSRPRTKDADKQTDFIDCVAWRQTAEFITRWFHKGSSILLEGSLQVRSFEDKNGQKRRVTEVNVDGAFFVDSLNEEAGGARGNGGTYIPDAYQTAANNAPKFEDIGDDEPLPF